MRKNTCLPLLIIFFVASCNQAFHTASVQYGLYKVQQEVSNNNSPVKNLLKPYSDSINKSMNDVMGENEKLLEKKPGNCTLGYFMTDAFLYMANQKFNTNVDAAFVNHGGIRLNEMPAGKISRGKLFELMPFDNILVLQKVKGAILKQYLDTLALDIAINQAGLSIQISNKKIKSIKVGDLLLDENREYVIANSDYVIGNSALLRNIPIQNIGYIQRDALIDYVKILTQQGKKIVVENVNRVVYVE